MPASTNGKPVRPSLPRVEQRRRSAGRRTCIGRARPEVAPRRVRVGATARRRRTRARPAPWRRSGARAPGCAARSASSVRGWISPYFRDADSREVPRGRAGRDARRSRAMPLVEELVPARQRRRLAGRRQVGHAVAGLGQRLAVDAAGPAQVARRGGGARPAVRPPGAREGREHLVRRAAAGHSVPGRTAYGEPVRHQCDVVPAQRCSTALVAARAVRAVVGADVDAGRADLRAPAGARRRRSTRPDDAARRRADSSSARRDADAASAAATGPAGSHSARVDRRTAARPTASGPPPRAAPGCRRGGGPGGTSNRPSSRARMPSADRTSDWVRLAGTGDDAADAT